MSRSLIPKILLPDFTWPDRRRPLVTVQIPPTPQPAGYWRRRFWGFIHWHLRAFSVHYCQWTRVPYDNQIAPLPFGLVLKMVGWYSKRRSSGDAGFPVPRMICYGGTPPISILMTRVPGEELGAVYGSLSDDQKESIFRELKTYLHTMRQWPNPCGGSRICSIAGMEIRSVRVPMHKVDPCENENMYSTNCLISTAYAGTFPSEDAYREARNRAEKIRSMPHQVLFTHGDLKHHNIMVHKGHITGFLDWESAGWYPEYWEYTTALRFIPKDFW